MKVAFLVDDYSAIGGIQRVVSIIASKLAEKNEVHVLSMYQEHGDTNNDLYSDKVVIKTLIKGQKKYIQQAFEMVNLIRKYLKEKQIDVLIASSEMLSPYCYLATKFLNVPFLVWTHTPALNNVEAKTQVIFKWLGVKKAKYTIALTDKTKEELSNKYKVNHIVSIPNPIDTKLLKAVNYNKDSKKIISVGRICYQKYYEKLVEVATLFLKKYPEWTWDIYGGGNDLDKIKDLIKVNNLESQINLKGDVTNLYDLYKDYSFQVLTSRFEGFPMTILEGVANGLPIVAFDIDGVNAIIKNNYNGLLAKPYEANEMAKMIEILIKNEAIRINYSQINVQERENYSIDKIAARWQEIINMVKIKF